MSVPELRYLKLIAFDLDGTLVDSVPELAKALNLALAQFTLPEYEELQVRNWIGNGVTVLLKRALCGDADYELHPEHPQFRDVKRAFDVHYSQILGQCCALYPGVRETLHLLVRQGYQLAIVTNKPHAFTLPLLKHLSVYELFDFVLSGDSLAKRKPDPLPLLTLAQMAECHMSEMLMVGDSHNDICAAKAAGIDSVGVTYGYNYGRPISLSEPDWVCDNFKDLLTLLPADEPMLAVAE